MLDGWADGWTPATDEEILAMCDRLVMTQTGRAALAATFLRARLPANAGRRCALSRPTATSVLRLDRRYHAIEELTKLEAKVQHDGDGQPFQNEVHGLLEIDFHGCSYFAGSSNFAGSVIGWRSASSSFSMTPSVLGSSI